MVLVSSTVLHRTEKRVRSGERLITVSQLWYSFLYKRIQGHDAPSYRAVYMPYAMVTTLLLNSSYFRYALQLLTPAYILATLAGRQHIELEDIQEMGELFLDAKSSASNISSGGIYLS